jgi:hypothetical protein
MSAILRPIEVGIAAAAWWPAMVCGFIRGTVLLYETAVVDPETGRAARRIGHWGGLGE